MGIGLEDPLYDLDVVDDIHASDDIFSDSNIEAVNDLITGDGTGQGDLNVRDGGVTTAFIEGGTGTGAVISVRDETGSDIGVELFNTANDGGQIDVNDDNNVAIAQMFASTDHGVLRNKQADGSILVDIGQFSPSSGGKVHVMDEAGALVAQMDADGGWYRRVFAHRRGIGSHAIQWESG